jgi:hypothetical protein
VRYIQNKEVVARQIEGETIIVPIRRGVGDMNCVYTLNPVERICDEFEVTPGEALNDIQGFLNSLLEEKLIHKGTDTEQPGSWKGFKEAEKKEAIVASSHVR